MLEGRWTIPITPRGNVARLPIPGDVRVPVVPVDDAAVERVAIHLFNRSFVPSLTIGETRWWLNAGEDSQAHWRSEAEAVLRAAGETP